MSKLITLTDLDGVVVNLVPEWFRIYGERTGEWVHPDSIIKYDFQSYVSDLTCFNMSLGDALESAMPVPGSLVGFNWLIANTEAYVLTYCHPAAPDAHRTKIEWLKRWFPAFDTDRLIATKHKHLVHGDRFIDDSAENVLAWDALQGSGATERYGYTFKTTYSNPDDSFDWEEIIADMKESV